MKVVKRAEKEERLRQRHAVQGYARNSSLASSCGAASTSGSESRVPEMPNVTIPTPRKLSFRKAAAGVTLRLQRWHR